MKKGQSMTPEQKEQYLRKRRATLIERYGDPNYNNMKKNLQTKLERYGDQNYNNQEKHKQTCIEKYGVEHHNQNKIIADKISKSKLDPITQAKFEKTMLEKYGNSNPNLVPEIKHKPVTISVCPFIKYIESGSSGSHKIKSFSSEEVTIL